MSIAPWAASGVTEIKRVKSVKSNKKEENLMTYFKKSGLVSILLALMLIGTLCPLGMVKAEEKPVIVMALDSDLDNLEPTFFKTDSAYYLVSNVYQTPLAEKYESDATGQVLMGQFTFEPEGSESLTYSDDGKCAILKIRKGMKFPNGKPVTAHSFKYGIDRSLLGPGYVASLLALGGVTSADQIQVKDDYTLQICAEKRTPMFESLFAFPVIPAMDEETSKAHATDEDPWATEWYKTNTMGSGPYILKEWTPGKEYIVEPNPDYWRGDDFFKNSRIVAKLIPSPENRELLLKKGAVDLAIGIPFKDVEDLKQDPNVNIIEIPYSRVRFLGWNNKIPPFDDVRVRRALMCAIPYDTILEKAIYGHGRPARSIIPSDFPTSDQDYWPYKTDPQKAKNLLKEAEVDGFDVPLAVRLSIPEDVEAATWIQSAFAEIGVNVTVDKMTDAQFFDKLNKHELPLFIHDWYSWLHDPFYQFNWLARCGQFTNYVDYCNPKLDELFDQGLYEPDPDKRAELSVEMQHIWLDDAPWAPLYHPNWIIGTGPSFKGFAVAFSLMLQYAHMTK
jgi:peptide/nickel transport system substrate-binding protein